MSLPRPFAIAGVLASIVLIVLGAGAIVIGASGHREVGTDLKREQIVGSPDMTPTKIRAAIADAGLKDIQGVPTCSVADQPIDSGSRAKCFASYMRIHALEATGGQTYAQMAQYLDASGKPTAEKAAAAKDPKTGAPVANGARAVWVTETGLSTALNTSFFAQQVALFSIVMGLALLLTGIGFLVLTGTLLRRTGTAAVAEQARVGDLATV
ncbi:MAG TPA: hypothetical protein VK501_06190 [Baekduia sp.]|uniref:hypothetical protein n=1 Tax=Baekduia sp. TaxID=2600305 RepID=UPI002C78AC1C|nr:hypothetical protein [Baekduia sp.]HMJ33486.1 hypothetical protein [Baekduia sp.]